MRTACLIAALLMTVPAFAQDNAGRGKELAATWCASCHRISPSSAEGIAPSFMDLSRNPRLTGAYIADWMRYSNHPVMPSFALPEDKALSIAAYIRSLNEPPGSEARSGGDDSQFREGEYVQLTGFFVTPRGHVVTTRRGLKACRMSYIQVSQADGSIAQASVVKTDVDNDIAILKADLRPRRYARLGNLDTLYAGQTVVAHGFPLDRLSAGAGHIHTGRIVSLSNPLGTGMQFQSDLPIMRGHAGGAVVDEDGAVVGMMTGTQNSAAMAGGGGAAGPDALSVSANVHAIKRNLVAISARYDEQLRRGKKSMQEISDLIVAISVRIAC